MSLPLEGGSSNFVKTAQDLINRQRKAGELLAQFNASGEVVQTRRDSERVFHEVFIIGEVEEWHPIDRGRVHMGWGIYPLNPHIGDPDTSPFKQAEAVSFADVDHITPKIGDIAHVRRTGNWVGSRLSIEIIQDPGDPKEVSDTVDAVENFLKPPNRENQ